MVFACIPVSVMFLAGKLHAMRAFIPSACHEHSSGSDGLPWERILQSLNHRPRNFYLSSRLVVFPVWFVPEDELSDSFTGAKPL